MGVHRRDHLLAQRGTSQVSTGANPVHALTFVVRLCNENPCVRATALRIVKRDLDAEDVQPPLAAAAPKGSEDANALTVASVRPLFTL